MEEEVIVWPKTPNPFYGLLLDTEETKQSGENGSKYTFAGESEGAITCTVSVNGDYLKVTGALHEVVTGALRELAHVSAKYLDGRGKLDAEYTMITKQNRQTGKIRRWVKQDGKTDRLVKDNAPDMHRAVEVIKLAKAAQELCNVSYDLWPVSAEQRRQNLINGPAPKVQKEKVEEEEEVDYGNHENNNNDESGHEKAIKALKIGHKDAIAKLQRNQQEEIRRIQQEYGKEVEKKNKIIESLKRRVDELMDEAIARYEEELTSETEEELSEASKDFFAPLKKMVAAHLEGEKSVVGSDDLSNRVDLE